MVAARASTKARVANESGEMSKRMERLHLTILIDEASFTLTLKAD